MNRRNFFALTFLAPFAPRLARLINPVRTAYDKIAGARMTFISTPYKVWMNPALQKAFEKDDMFYKAISAKDKIKIKMS